MKRAYEALLEEHLSTNRQMAMLCGPRQVGKTTTSRASAGEHRYFTWDRLTDKRLITKGADAVLQELSLDDLDDRRLINVVFDEIHKYSKWRAFLKGFFDVAEKRVRLIVTGSARLGFFRRGGDSLMGRYFLYRMHPLSIGELLRAGVRETELSNPVAPPKDALPQLLRFGGFPEPFLKNSDRFYNRWRRLRSELLFREDLRDLTLVQEVGQVQLLAQMLAAQAGQLVNYSSLANDLNVSVGTVKRWIAMLQALFHCFTLRPWFRNVPKSLRKQPKVFLWDWSLVADKGARNENLVASHLLKAVHWWTDIGLGSYALYYLRDKQKREVDFLVVREGEPWFLVEVKSAEGRRLNPALEYFQEKTGAQHAFQVAADLDFVERDCFSEHRPIRVPAETLLSQLP